MSSAGGYLRIESNNIGFMDGKTYDKLAITRCFSISESVMLEKNCCIRILCGIEPLIGEANVKIRVFAIADDKMFKNIPKSILDGSDVIHINFCTMSTDAPEYLIPKIRLKKYYAKHKTWLKPRSAYHAYSVSDLQDLNWEKISSLSLESYYDSMVDMIKYLKSNCSVDLKRIEILYRDSSPRSNAPFLDISELSDIKVKKITLLYGKYIGFKKLLKTSNVVSINWTSVLLNDSILEELKQDEQVDISDNYTLLNYYLAPPISSFYGEDIGLIVERNREFNKNKRYASTKCAINW